MTRRASSPFPPQPSDADLAAWLATRNTKRTAKPAVTCPALTDLAIRAGENPPEETWLSPAQTPARIAQHLQPGDRAIVCRFAVGAPAMYQICRAGKDYQPGDNAAKLAAKATKPAAPQYPSYTATPTATVRLSAEQHAELTRQAQAQGTTLSALLRQRLAERQELETLQAQAYALLTDFERADAAKIKDSVARTRFVISRLARKRSK